MAEAVVDERAPLPTRFYCHVCSVEINIPNLDFTCPHCAGGFVEELPALPSSGSASSSASSLADASSSNTDALGLNRLVDLEVIRGEIETLLMSRNGPIEIAIGPANRRNNMVLGGGSGGSSSSVGGSGVGSSSGSGPGTGGGRVHPPHLGSLDTVLLDFLQSLSGGDDGTGFGNPQMFFMGNPGDYAWGREGIDTIVTQLLNQMETSGPPPLPKEKIDEIPKVQVSAEDVERKLQCSVCWEDFRIDETVRRLPCSHIYHENCIVPWLDLHGTCPICRKSLSDDDETNDSGGNNTDGATGSSSVAAAITTSTHAAEPGIARTGGSNTAGTASASNVGNRTGNGTSQNQQNQQNIFGFDDSAVDLD